MADEVWWDAVLFQEGPYSAEDTYNIVDGGHAFFVGACKKNQRSTCILLHWRWLDREADLTFTPLGHRLSCLDLKADGLKLRLSEYICHTTNLMTRTTRQRRCVWMNWSSQHGDLAFLISLVLMQTQLSGKTSMRKRLKLLDSTVSGCAQNHGHQESQSFCRYAQRNGRC